MRVWKFPKRTSGCAPRRARCSTPFAARGNRFARRSRAQGGSWRRRWCRLLARAGFSGGRQYAIATRRKISALGVSPLTISEHFAESRQCAEEMARGALALYGADASVAATGFLDGNVGEKPAELAGAVFLCSAVRSGRGVETFCARLSLDPSADRNFNRAAAAACALESLKLSACASLFRRP